jgi:hypothetical protein
MPTELDRAMFAHMHYIVFIERRPFSFIDFKIFQVGSKKYSMKHGTFRNKISGLIRKGIVQLDYKSHISFYTLRGLSFAKDSSVTDNHMGNTAVTNITEVIEFIEQLPMGDKSIHDIHMKFQVPDIWKIVSLNKKYPVNPYSKDIRLEPLITDNMKIQTTIHHTDTVSVVVGCSRYPVVLEDFYGIIRLSNALTRVEERTSRVLDESGEKLEGGYERIPIPSNERWLITLWHFGRDTQVEYRGKGFSLTWGYGREALYRIYTKELNGKIIVRSEKQESLNKKVGSILRRE